MDAVPYPAGRGRLFAHQLFEHGVEGDADGAGLCAELAHYVCQMADHLLPKGIIFTAADVAFFCHEGRAKGKFDRGVGRFGFIYQGPVTTLPCFEIERGFPAPGQPGVDVVRADEDGKDIRVQVYYVLLPAGLEVAEGLAAETAVEEFVIP